MLRIELEEVDVMANNDEPRTVAEEADNGPRTPAESSVNPEELESLRSKAAERDQYLELAQRTRAEFENYQKRARKDREEESRYRYAPLAFDLLPVLDNLERTLAAAEQAGETGALVQGVRMVQSQFLDLLKRHGINRIEALGKLFDPNLHQAIMQQEGKTPNTVLQVVEPGYMNQDRVLRPAKVIVSK
jgi:molecular chaperone GrpE